MSEPYKTATWRCHNTVVKKGDELTVRGERGARFKFLAYCVTASHEWIDCYGGRPGHEMFRSFDPERVAIVHRTHKRRGAA